MTRVYVPFPIRRGGRVAFLAWRAGVSYQACKWIAVQRWLP